MLDIGCGSGQVAIDVARTVPGSAAVGVDLSNAQLDVARSRAGDLHVDLVQADAQVHDFGAGAFDVVASRTGTMFLWLREFLGAIGRVRPLRPPPVDAPGPFSMSDPDRVHALLEPAGWSDIAFTEHDEPMWFGPDPDAATRFIVGQMAWLLANLDDRDQRQARANLHDVMTAHAGPDGVLLGSGAWLVTARRRLSRGTRVHLAP